MGRGKIGKDAQDAVAKKLIKNERDILDGIVEYGIAWLDRLMRNTKKADNVRLMALRTAKSFRDYERKQDAAGVDGKKGKGSGELQAAVGADLARLRARKDKPAGGSE